MQLPVTLVLTQFDTACLTSLGILNGQTADCELPQSTLAARGRHVHRRQMDREAGMACNQDAARVATLVFVPNQSPHLKARRATFWPLHYKDRRARATSYGNATFGRAVASRFA